MSDQSDNRFYRQRSSSSEHEIQRELRRQIAAEIDTTINQALGCLEWGTYRNGFVAGLEAAKKIARGEA